MPVQDATLDAFLAFDADALAEFDADELESRAQDVADDLVESLGPEAAEAASLLRESAGDRQHPFLETLREETLVPWNGTDEHFAQFRSLATTIADRIDQELTRRIVILTRSDSYEGLERPGLGAEVPPERAARGHELEVARDLYGLRRFLIDLGHDGVTGYDLVALGEWNGAGWEFLGFDVADQDGRSAIVHHPSDDAATNEHGLFWRHDEAQAFLRSSGAARVVPVRRFRRSGIRPGQAIWYARGNEQADNDPFGRITLTIDADNHATLEHFWRQSTHRWTADAAADVVKDVKGALARAGFPVVPPHPRPPGAAMRQIEVVDDDRPEWAMMEEQFGSEADGYKDAFEILDSLAVQLSAGHYEGAQDTLGPMIANHRAST